MYIFINKDLSYNYKTKYRVEFESREEYYFDPEKVQQNDISQAASGAPINCVKWWKMRSRSCFKIDRLGRKEK